MKCRNCKKQMMQTTDDHPYRESGLDSILLKGVDVFRCDCGERVVSIPAMPELNALIGRTLVQKKAQLTGNEIRFLRKNMGLTGKRMSEIMGVDNATLSRWESDLQRPTKTHDHFIRLLYVTEKQIPTDQVKQFVEVVFPAIDPSALPMPDMVLNPGAWIPH